MNGLFLHRYKELNARQKEAVDTIEGPVMVIAGPGTGKTQVLALRIGNILKKTDTQADGILCLTFTNSGVEAMRERLYEYIGPDASKVMISTFHAFGVKLIEEFYHTLGFERAPKLLDDQETLSLIDHILNSNEWHHIRPRGNASMYFKDLRSLVSLLIRERLSPDDVLKEIRADQARLKKDPESISSRGARKGDLKMEVVNKLESLEKTCEVVTFYKLYEAEKRERLVMDYDDVLRFMVELVNESDDAQAAIRERYLYVLVDEHQDSSLVQNQFLKAVWGDVESPNVFVVGDDRQLIYGFSGASLSYFEEFKNTFKGTKVITLTDNYRSTQRILDAADILLKSSLAEGSLVSQRKDDHPIELVECEYPRDEILAAGTYFKERMAEGIPAEECILLVPKNSHIRSAVRVLEDLGIPVSASNSAQLFDTSESAYVRALVRTLSDPFSAHSIADALLDPLSGVPTLDAHTFLHETRSRDLSLKKLEEAKGHVGKWGTKIMETLEDIKHKSVYEAIQYIGKTFLLDTAVEHDDFVRRVEIVRTLLHLALSLEERGEKTSLKVYIAFLDRLYEYGEDIPLAIFGAEKGVKVKTLHGSKGLEFEVVWIAHMNERALMSGKQMGFTLPERIKALEEKKDELAAKREVYVALTRAKRFAVLSYAKTGYRDTDEQLASVVAQLPQNIFAHTKKIISEEKLLKSGIEQSVVSHKAEHKVTKDDLRELVRERYTNRKISVTLLNHFYDCPWKWYFNCFLEVPEPLSESLEFGSIVHSAIEKIILLKHTPTAKEIGKAIEEAIDECHIVDEKKILRITREAKAAVERFVKHQFNDLYDAREAERSLSYKDPRLPKLVMYGKLDLLEFNEAHDARVTDFKTGKTRKATEIEKLDDEGRMSTYMRQLAMYSYLLYNAAKGRIEVEKSRLYFVEEEDVKKARYETHITDEQVELLIKDIEDYDLLMQSGEWTERPCNYKSHKGELDCPYCEKAKMYR